MACLRVEGPADRVAAAWQAATAVGLWRVDLAKAHDESLTLDQARADAVLDLVIGMGESAAPSPVAPVTVNVIVPPGDAPAELVGHGPLPAAATPQPGDTGVGAVRAWHVDATGVVAAVGPSKGYVPSPRLAATVRARDLTCRFPGCARPAERCDLDHVTPYPTGTTDADNLAALCRRHHRLKTHSRWRVQSKPGGILEWTSPTGHRYATHPPAWISETRKPPPQAPPPPAPPPAMAAASIHAPIDDDPPF
jgi:hypothetical protein